MQIIHAFAPAEILKTKPREEDLRRHVCSIAGEKWHAVCTYLGIHNAKKQFLVESNSKNVEEAFFQALCYWCTGNTSKEATWSVLLDALREAELNKCADDLMTKLLDDATVSSNYTVRRICWVGVLGIRYRWK